MTNDLPHVENLNAVLQPSTYILSPTCLQAIVDSHQEPAFILVDLKITAVNEVFLKNFNTFGTLTSKLWPDCMTQLGLHVPLNFDLADPSIGEIHTQMIGSQNTFGIRAHALKSGSNRLYLIKIRSLSHIMDLESALQKQNQLFEALIWSMPNGLVITDSATKVLIANHNWMSWVQQTLFQILGKPLNHFFEDSTAIEDCLLESHTQASTNPQRMRLKSGKLCEIVTTRLIDSQGRFFGHILLAKDIARLSEMEEMLRQAQKMEALGNMACSVAHDFNNILNVIVGFTEYLAEAIAADPEWKHSLTNIERAAQSGVQLTRQLLAFSRRQEINLRIVALNELIHTFREVLVTQVGREIHLILDLEEPGPPIQADPGQIEQVLLNLCGNAKDATLGSGKIRIATNKVNVLEQRGEIPCGVYFVLTVQDWGSGIDTNTKAHIFEPFFTTKPEGKGTGMGLATVYGIVKQSNGFIEVESEQAKGTSFRLFFPIA